MATRYQDISYGNFGGGIDALSPESKIPDGFVEYLRNVDPTPEGSLEKRKGYQLYGAVPARVERITYGEDETNPTKGDLCFYLDTDVNVLNLRSSPIVVYGHTSECHSAGDWTDKDQYQYYDSFTVDVKRTIPIGAVQQPEYLLGSVHKQGSDVEVITVQATSETTTSNLQLIENVTIDSATADITATFTNYQDEPLNIFLLAKSREAQPGTCYVGTFSVNANSTYTYIASAVEHKLNSFDINTTLYQVVNGTYTVVTPDQIQILANGNVQITLTNKLATLQNYRVMLFSPPDGESTQWTIGAESAPPAMKIPVTSDFPLFQLYSYSNGIRTRIWPEKIEIDAVTKEARITIVNNSTSSLDIRAYWDYAQLVSNRLCVVASTPVSTSSTQTISPLDHGLERYMSVGVSQSTNVLSTDNRQLSSTTTPISVSKIAVDLVNTNLNVTFNNTATTSEQAWVAVKARNAITGSCYQGTALIQNGVDYISIPASTHGIAGTLLGVDVYRETLTEYIHVQESAVTIQPNGDVLIQIDNPALLSYTARVYVYNTAATEVQTGFALPNTTTVITANMGTNLFPFLNCYNLSTSNGTVTKNKVYPTNVSLNSTNNKAYISFANPTPTKVVEFLGFNSTISLLGHGLSSGSPVSFTTTNYGVTANTVYYVIASGLTTNVFKISATVGGPALTLTSGTQTMYSFTSKLDKTASTITTSIPHGLVVGQPVAFSNISGITNLTANTIYYVQSVSSTTIFKIAATSGGAAITFAGVDGTAVVAPALNLSINWDYADRSLGTYCVAPPVATQDGYTDDHVQMTIWGLPQAGLYGATPTGTAPGWVNHLDTYRAQGEERPVCGLGGNLFASYTGNELGLPTYYPNLRARVSDAVIIGPTFIGSTQVSTRTNGSIKFNGGETNEARATSAIYNSSTGFVDYTIYTPAVTATPSLTGAVAIDGDYLTATNMGYPVHEGEFLIKDIYQTDSNHIVISVYNPNVTSSDWNDPNSGGIVALYSDSIPIDATCPFIQDDRILSIDWGAEQLLQATSTSSGLTLRLKGALEALTIADGLLLVGQRKAHVVPIRELDGTPNTYQLVPGDVLQYNDLKRELRVKSVIAGPNITSFTVTGDGDTATVNLFPTTNIAFSIGQRILLLDAGPFTGEQVITSFPTKTTFTFASTITSTEIPVTIQGNCIEVDEALDWSDSVDNIYPFDIARRWMPIEAPATSYPLVNQNRFRYFPALPYDSQSMIRSTMVKDTLYLTNGEDAIQRFDGSSISRAGLIRWQAGLFMTTDTGAASTISVSTVSLPVSLSATNFNIEGIPSYTNRLTVTNGAETFFKVGQRVRYTESGTNKVTDATIESLTSTSNPAHGYIKLSAGNIITYQSTADTLKTLAVYRYYFRLNLYDVNDNIIVTGATGAQDHVITLDSSAAVNMTLLRPTWIDNYDYSRIELQIYRTKQDNSTNYYRLTTLPVYWANSEQAYIQYQDTASDDTLTELDSVLSALAGINLGQTWTGPVRAKYITSGNNRLVLGNIRSWPNINVSISDTGNSINLSALTGLTWLLRKDNTDALTTTDNKNRMAFEFVTNNSKTFTPTTALQIDVTTGIVTATIPNHGLTAVGDWFYLFHADQANGQLTRLGGWYQVLSLDIINNPTQFTFQIDPILAVAIGSTGSATDVDTFVKASVPSNIPVWLGTDGLYMTVNSQTSGNLGPKGVAVKRLASAINAAQNICSTVGFKPWVVAYAGGEFEDSGQILFETPYGADTTLELVLPAYNGFNMFANGILVRARESVQAVSQRFPSRLVMSYQNYPELFDNPTAYSDTESESAIDVNSADGQEITGIIPFFGEAAFGAAQKDAILLVFKTASVYLVNLAEKAAGRNAVQKLDTRGLGCTAPFSIAPTQNGIMFANQSGIYRITTGLEMQYIGRRMERVWKEEVNTTSVANTYGHYSALENKYKLSVPVIGSNVSYPTEALVYNTVREYSADGYRDGSWTIYDNMPSIGWVNLLTGSLFASPQGEVFAVRQANDTTDYRDDGSAITAQATLRALDFGSSGIRKTVATFILQFRTAIYPEQVTVESAVNLVDQWEVLDAATIKARYQDALSTVEAPRVAVIRFTSNRRKGVFFQIRVTNDSYDEGMDLLGASVLVAALGPQGTVEAADTKALK